MADSVRGEREHYDDGGSGSDRDGGLIAFHQGDRWRAYLHANIIGAGGISLKPGVIDIVDQDKVAIDQLFIGGAESNWLGAGFLNEDVGRLRFIIKIGDADFDSKEITGGGRICLGYLGRRDCQVEDLGFVRIGKVDRAAH